MTRLRQVTGLYREMVEVMEILASKQKVESSNFELLLEHNSWALTILTEFSADLVPLMIPDKGGEPKAVRVVLTSSEEDKKLLKSELRHLKEEQDKEIRGFREVIDAISASYKPVVSYGCLNVHQGNLVTGHTVLKITHTFAKLCSLLKSTPSESVVHDCPTSLEDYSNKFYPCYSSNNEPDGDVPSLSTKCFSKERNSENVVFLWGFGHGITGGELKNLLCGIYGEFSKDLEVLVVDKSCFVVVCWRPGLAESLLKVMQGSSEAVGFSALREMISEGLKAAGYEAYRKACRFGYLEASLADSLDRALLEQPCFDPTADCSRHGTSEIYWYNDSMIQLSDL
ncbi:hypothetical protein ACLOJK_023007 [Asimina triloba]